MHRSYRLPLLILDCDGVLIRSERANLAYYNHLFEKFDLPQVDENDRGTVGLLHTLSTPQVLARFVPDALRDDVSAYAGGLDFTQFMVYLEAEPGWVGVLERRASFERAVVATNRGRSARTVLDAIGVLPLLDDVVTVHDVVRPKPHPDLLVAALERWGLPATEALYVGDSDLDARAARAAGVPFLGFRRESPPSEDDPWGVEAHLGRLATGEMSGRIRLADA